jgi:hypothetical protein
MEALRLVILFSIRYEQDEKTRSIRSILKQKLNKIQKYI